MAHSSIQLKQYKWEQPSILANSKEVGTSRQMQHLESSFGSSFLGVLVGSVLDLHDFLEEGIVVALLLLLVVEGSVFTLLESGVDFAFFEDGMDISFRFRLRYARVLGRDVELLRVAVLELALVRLLPFLALEVLLLVFEKPLLLVAERRVCIREEGVGSGLGVVVDVVVAAFIAESRSCL